MTTASPYTRMVVPVDGSPAAEAILPFVLDVAAPLEIEVVLLTVVDEPEATAREAETYLAGLARRLAWRGVRSRTLVRSGDPVREILAGAAEVQADLIAMTTHGRSGLGRLLFGSVAEAVLRRAEVPVFLMRLTEATVSLEAEPWRQRA